MRQMQDGIRHSSDSEELIGKRLKFFPGITSTSNLRYAETL